MDIYFRNTSGSRVGFIDGERNIKDTSGNRLGWINGNDIHVSTVDRVGYLNGNDFKDTFGNRVGYINGKEIRDAYGHRVGYPEESASNIEMCAAGFLLFGLKAQQAPAQQSPSRQSPAQQAPERPGGFLGVVVFFIPAFIGLFKAIWAFIKGPFVALSLIKETSERKEWWGTCMRSLLVGLLFILIIWGGIAQPKVSQQGTWVQYIWGLSLLVFVLAFVVFPIIAVSIRRMHDIGKRGWWILIPIVGFVLCGFFPSKYEGNPYI